MREGVKTHRCFGNMASCPDCMWVFCKICGAVLGEITNERGARASGKDHADVHDKFFFYPPKEIEEYE